MINETIQEVINTLEAIDKEFIDGMSKIIIEDDGDLHLFRKDGGYYKTIAISDEGQIFVSVMNESNMRVFYEIKYNSQKNLDSLPKELYLC